MRKLIIILPTMPHYRIGLLNTLNLNLEKRGIRLIVIAGDKDKKRGITTKSGGCLFELKIIKRQKLIFFEFYLGLVKTLKNLYKKNDILIINPRRNAIQHLIILNNFKELKKYSWGNNFLQIRRTLIGSMILNLTN